MRAKALAAFPSCSTGTARSYTTTRGYLDECLHIAVKQLMVIHGAWPRLPHFLWFRGKGGGPGNDGQKEKNKQNKRPHCVKL